MNFSGTATRAPDGRKAVTLKVDSIPDAVDLLSDGKFAAESGGGGEFTIKGLHSTALPAAPKIDIRLEATADPQG